MASQSGFSHMTPLSLLVLVLTSYASADPLCRTVRCQQGTVCRPVESCNGPNSCTVQARCVPKQLSDYNSGGCTPELPYPLLERLSNGSLDLRSCYRQKPCGEGFYCSTRLQDVASRCCRAEPEITKPGSCPKPEIMDQFFCVDECRSDADCDWRMKCCQNSQSCTSKTCKMPDPCSLKQCLRGEMCVVNKQYRAECVPAESPRCPDVQCRMYCQHGYELDTRGCRTCRCIEAPPPPGNRCGDVMCMIYCEHGHVLDSNGCKTCSCLQAPPAPSGQNDPFKKQIPELEDEPLCRNQNCLASHLCRVAEECRGGRCQHRAVCLPRDANNYLSGGCKIGSPLLEAAFGTRLGYQLRVCHNKKQCADGFYCSTELQDVSSRCCRAAKPQTKQGSCPAPSKEDFYFCVNECRGDGDCRWNQKCCQKSQGCQSTVCSNPDPCSLKTCGQGFKCVVNPDFKADCVPAPNNINNDQARPQGPTNQGQGQGQGLPQGVTGQGQGQGQGQGVDILLDSWFHQRRLTCPNPYYPSSPTQCQAQQTCGFPSAQPCPAFESCCATRHCGNICRRLVRYWW